MIRGQLNAFILKSIEEKPMSGYSLMKSIGETIGSRPSSGSVYPLLEKMRAEGAIEIKKEGRRKVYSINDRGKEKLHELMENQDELLNKVKEGFKTFLCLSNRDMGFFEELFENLKRGELPFREINPELVEFRNTVFGLFNEGKVKQNKKEIKRILRRAIDGLKRL